MTSGRKKALRVEFSKMKNTDTWMFNIKSGNYNVLASAWGYNTKDGAHKGAQVLRESMATAVFVDLE